MARFYAALAVILTVLFLPYLVRADAAPPGYYDDGPGYTRKLRNDYRQFRRESRLERLERELARERRRVRRVKPQRSYARYDRRYDRAEAEYRRMVAIERRRMDRKAEERRRAREERLELERAGSRRYSTESRYPPERYAEFDARETRVRRDMTAKCQPQVVGRGVGRWLGGGAKNDALKDWGRQVERLYGAEYVNPRRALNSAYMCDPVCSDCVRTRCRYRAIPCRAEF
jgi:hypothetical protein